ncbi:MAG TPA: hypothetical protein VGK20_02015 [Candidatus Binatia bacterium]|jgi:hypothetical protein
MEPGEAGSRRWIWFRRLALAHFALLVAIRLLWDSDDFTNWDLISFLNANSFVTLGNLLARPELHFHNPFSFPLYNTGAESVLSVLLHRLFSQVSLFWSNTAVLVVYDVMFVAAAAALFRLVLRDPFPEGLAWLLLAMSPVVLTNLSISAFNMQAFATITFAVLGCELMLQGGAIRGLLALALAFAWISQAYPLTFFLPFYALGWIGVRTVALATKGEPRRTTVLRSLLAVSAVLAGVAVVNLGSDGAYVHKVLHMSAGPWNPDSRRPPPPLVARVAALAGIGFFPRFDRGAVLGGFAPYALVASLVVFGVLACLGRWRAKLPRPSPTLLGTVLVLGWCGLLLFAYSPGFIARPVKSQRLFFGDFFLVLALAGLALWMLRQLCIPARVLVATCLLLGAASDAWVLGCVFTVDHHIDHRPLFDYDPADGIVRHQMQEMIRVMRHEADDEHAGLIIYYPRSRSENATDPSMFFARFLREFGTWRGRADVLFPCRFCSVRYGCPFPNTASTPCGRRCCYADPARQAGRLLPLRDRSVYVWWYSDRTDDDDRRDAALDELSESYSLVDLGAPYARSHWRHWLLVPNGKERQGNQARKAAPVQGTARDAGPPVQGEARDAGPPVQGEARDAGPPVQRRARDSAAPASSPPRVPERGARRLRPPS